MRRPAAFGFEHRDHADSEAFGDVVTGHDLVAGEEQPRVERHAEVGELVDGRA